MCICVFNAHFLHGPIGGLAAWNYAVPCAVLCCSQGVRRSAGRWVGRQAGWQGRSHEILILGELVDWLLEQLFSELGRMAMKEA